MSGATSGITSATANPLLETWTAPFGLPPFDRIKPEHYRPAFEAALERNRAEIDAIANDPAEPTFENTVDALERSGDLLDRVGGVFWNLAGAHTNPELQGIEREMSPKLAKHFSDIAMNAALFGRVDALFGRIDDLDLDDEQRRVLELTHKRFVRAGAKLQGPARERLAAIVERLAALGTQFSQNVLADEAGYKLVLETDADKAGLPDWLLDAARRAGDEGGHPGQAVITLSRSSIEPFLQFSTNRALREKAFEAWTHRGQMGGETDNRAIVAETLRLRAERARLLGYPTFAAYKLDNTMAKTPGAVQDLLDRVWAPAKLRAAEERDDLAEAARAEGANIEIGPHDWRHYAAKVRKAKHDLDEAELKPYFQLERMIEAAFDTATRLFGVRFTERPDLPVYHPDVRAWEVTDADGEHVAVFLGDYFARPSKRSGAWMSSYRGQRKLGGEVRPIIVNVMNFSKGGEGQPSLLSFDDARTLFHEFGHGLHGMLSDVVYPSIAGTSVSRDFVEFPSQLYEHWLMQPAVLRRFARHAETGEPMPEALLARVLAARNFNQGFATVEYTSSALVDLAFHSLENADDIDPIAFEAGVLQRLGMPPAMVMRHRTPHFAHVFSGDGYSSGYYSYLWSEVLDADGFAAFEEAGDIFSPGVAERLKTFVYSAGGKQDPAEAYRAFRGRDPDVQALLRKRGFLGDPNAQAPAGDA
ncbi:dipeptidyl carboxypeptidase II [Alsobacter metallidurans]|uniref:Dipeptidyl carboxypeptidase II n=1 Tax=Alsobacter metallidurans TaxID=340221 RepID=A0A917I4W7_9HYPH|nr:M3 family metallopeptidase [Alsobacter metallidurans]GGH09278.1 dipeptidyl carboxypeptidase II [Alsobacter metallidurans]